MSTLLKLDCADKKAHHPDALSPGIMPFHPSVVIAAGRKGSGKGATVKQLLMLAAPAYDKIYICHYDPKTEEWNDCDPTKIFSIDDLPSDPTEFLDRSEKNALVIDEIPFEGMNRANKGKIDRVEYVCTTCEAGYSANCTISPASPSAVSSAEESLFSRILNLKSKYDSLGIK